MLYSKNNCAPIPPMGWNSYDYYDTTVNEAQVRANADYMAAHLKQFGWEYIVVDIEWYAHGAGTRRNEFQYIPFSTFEMDEYGRLLPDPERFPSSVNGAGFTPLADYIHSLGLKFGIHIMRGIPRIAAHNHMPICNSLATADQIADPSSICGWNPDMYGIRNTSQGQDYYDSIVELYASWGVDFIKCDDICNTNLYPHNPYSARHEIEMLSSSIQKTGRPIVLSLSPGPALIEHAWHYETYANMWRITDDFWDHWDALKDMFTRCELWQNHVKTGCYPDCDMLPIGRLGKGFGNERSTLLTHDEQRTMFTLWSLFGSPMMLGCELTLLDEWTTSLITNKNILKLLSPDYVPHQLSRDENHAIWTVHNEKEKSDYVAIFNLCDKASCYSITPQLLTSTVEYSSALELWSNEIVPFSKNGLSITLSPHGCAIYELLRL